MMYSAHKWCAWITTVYTLFIRQQNRQHRRQPVEHNTMSVHRRSQEFVTEGHSWGPKDRNSRPKSRIGFLGEGAAPSLPARSSGERRKLPQQGSWPQMHFGLTKSPENAPSDHKCRSVSVYRLVFCQSWIFGGALPAVPYTGDAYVSFILLI